MKPDDKNKIGSLIQGKAYRDAVHVAVAPAVAGEDLEPGDPVSFTGDGTIVNYRSNKRVGIVDPFLTDPVKKGEQCWVFLYPGTAQNLRHEWDHPDFRTAEQPSSESVDASKMWLQCYAEQHKLTLEDLLAGVAKYVEDNCDRAVFDDDFKEYETPDVFWAHYLMVTGKTGNGNFWGCCI